MGLFRFQFMHLACVATLVGPSLPRAFSEPPAPTEYHRLADEMDAYLWRHVLNPRLPVCVDQDHGGFHTNYGQDWSALNDRGRFIVYQARLTWTAAIVARLRPDSRSECLPYVRHGIRYLADVMWDRKNGGFHTYVDLSGNPSQFMFMGHRPVYGQAFAIYALAAAHAVTGDEEALDLARRAYRWIEEHYRDDLGPGYRNSLQPDGQPVPDRQVNERRGPAALPIPSTCRTMNDHIHLLEAYSELFRSWPDPGLRSRTEELLGFVRDRLFVEPGCLYFALHPDGRAVPAPVSFGHDVETAFLLIEAEEALGRPVDPTTDRAARMLVDHALALGFDPVRGQLFESGSAYGPPIDRSIEWWGQFEAFNAFLLMHERHGQDSNQYWTAFLKAWTLALDTLTDRQHPGVCPGIDHHGSAVCHAKSHDWFASYHTARALLLSSDRLRRMATTAEKPRTETAP
ncbi:MAG: AGE family epimerase/isomerase [Vicinamibacteria bacterium]|nr:AGE family epimerase/isomerase [Vicinamibacteria bacterium]